MEGDAADARRNRRFHDIIVDGAGNGLLRDLIQRVYAVPFVDPGVVAFNAITPEDIFPILLSGHHQHHAVVDAIEARQPDVAEALMRGHSDPARRRLALDRPGAADSAPMPESNRRKVL